MTRHVACLKGAAAKETQLTVTMEAPHLVLMDLLTFQKAKL